MTHDQDRELQKAGVGCVLAQAEHIRPADEDVKITQVKE